MERWDADYDPRKGTYHYSRVVNITDQVEDNLEQQINGNNGWTEDRSMRKIASIPPSLFYRWYIGNGIANLPKVDQQAALWKFISGDQRIRTVDKLKHDTAHQTHIVVK